MKTFLIILEIVFILLVVINMFRSEHRFRTMLVSTVGGVALLTVINLVSQFTGLYIPVNAWSVGCSVAGGVPGVALLAAIKVLCP